MPGNRLIDAWRRIPIAIRLLSILLWILVGVMGVSLVMNSDFRNTPRGIRRRATGGFWYDLARPFKQPVGVFLVIAAGATIAQQWVLEVLCVVLRDFE